MAVMMMNGILASTCRCCNFDRRSIHFSGGEQPSSPDSSFNFFFCVENFDIDNSLECLQIRIRNNQNKDLLGTNMAIRWCSPCNASPPPSFDFISDEKSTVITIGARLRASKMARLNRKVMDGEYAVIHFGKRAVSLKVVYLSAC